eukprot:1900290-Ditylum_brightwellii.AAC.1
MYNIVTVYYETGDDDEAIKFYEETLQVEKEALGADHKSIVLTLKHLGQVHQQHGELVKTLNCFQQALEIERK